MEELSVNPESCDWFSARVYGSIAYASGMGTWYSVVDGALGESDIVHVFISPAGERVALLIENKINASPQFEQGERYTPLFDEDISVLDAKKSVALPAVAPKKSAGQKSFAEETEKVLVALRVLDGLVYDGQKSGGLARLRQGGLGRGLSKNNRNFFSQQRLFPDTAGENPAREFIHFPATV